MEHQEFDGSYRVLSTTGAQIFDGTNVDEVTAYTIGLLLQYRLWASTSGHTEVNVSAGPTLVSLSGSRAAASTYTQFSSSFDFSGARSLGARVDIEATRELAPRFKLAARVGYARSRVSGIEADDPAGAGTLTAYRLRSFWAPSSWRDQVWNNPIVPTFSNRDVRDLHDATVDLSGVRAQVGIQISF